MKFLSTFMAAVLAAVMLIAAVPAEAKRMGGGGSFGRQSGNVTQRQATPPAATPATPPAPATSSPANTPVEPPAPTNQGSPAS